MLPWLGCHSCRFSVSSHTRRRSELFLLLCLAALATGDTERSRDNVTSPVTAQDAGHVTRTGSANHVSEHSSGAQSQKVVEQPVDDGDYDYDTYDAELMKILTDQNTVVTSNQSAGTPAPVIADVPTESAEEGEEQQQQQQPPPVLTPHVQQQLRLITATAGHQLVWQLPANTFVDLASVNTAGGAGGGGDQFRVTLLQENGDRLDSDRWLHFDSAKQTLLALPLADNVGEHVFTLRATGAHGASVDTPLRLHVLDDYQSTDWSHQLLLTVLTPDTDNQVGWQLDLLARLHSLTAVPLGGATSSSSVDDLFVHSVRTSDQQQQQQQQQQQRVRHSISLSWTTLAHSSCPTRSLSTLSGLLINSDGSPSPTLRAALSPQFTVHSVQLKLLAPCQHETLKQLQLPADGAAAAVGRSSLEQQQQQLAAPAAGGNTAPVLRLPLTAARVRLGTLLDVPVGDDVFYDLEDGTTWNMTVRLLNTASTTTSSGSSGGGGDSWVQLNIVNRRVQALPLSHHLVGNHSLLLECVDSGGLAVTATFLVVVDDNPLLTATASFATATAGRLPALALHVRVRLPMQMMEQQQQQEEEVRRRPRRRRSRAGGWLPGGISGALLAHTVARTLSDGAGGTGNVSALTLFNISDDGTAAAEADKSHVVTVLSWYSDRVTAASPTVTPLDTTNSSSSTNSNSSSSSTNSSSSSRSAEVLADRVPGVTQCPQSLMQSVAQRFTTHSVQLAAQQQQQQAESVTGPGGWSVVWAGVTATPFCQHVRLHRSAWRWAGVGTVEAAALFRQRVLLSYVLPAVLMLVMVVVAALVAWQLVLLRRRHHRHRLVITSSASPSASSSSCSASPTSVSLATNGVTKPLLASVAPPNAATEHELQPLAPATGSAPVPECDDVTADTPMLPANH